MIIRGLEQEMEMYRKYSTEYGFTFFVIQNGLARYGGDERTVGGPESPWADGRGTGRTWALETNGSERRAGARFRRGSRGACTPHRASRRSSRR